MSHPPRFDPVRFARRRTGPSGRPGLGRPGLDWPGLGRPGLSWSIGPAAVLSAAAFLAFASAAPGQVLRDVLQEEAELIGEEEIIEAEDAAEEEEGAADDGPVAGRGGRYDYRNAEGETDSVDARFPQNPERIRQLKAIARAVGAGDWDRAADALLFVVGEANGEVVRLSSGRSATVVDEARRLFARFPEKEREALNRRLGGAAQAALDAALDAGDSGAVRDVAVRFPTTDAAVDARVRLALWHLDRGESGLAARRFADLLDDPSIADPLAEPRLKAAAIAAFARGGEPERAQTLWAGLPPAARAASGLATGADPSALPATLTGGAGGTNAGGDPAGGGAGGPSPIEEPLLVPRWDVPIITDAAEREAFREAVDRLQRADSALLPVWEPLTASVDGRDLVLARTDDGIVAVDAATGEAMWRSRTSGLAVRGATRQITVYTHPGSQSLAENNLTISAVYREAAFGKLTTDGVRVFLLEADEEASGAPIQQFGRSTGTLGRPVRLVAYRLDTGRLDWEIGGTLRDEPFDLPLAGWRPLAAPVVDGGDLFVVAERVAAEGLRQVALFCLDPVTGRARWNRTVASAEASVNVDPVRAEWGAWCAVADGVVIVPTTVGWVAAVDRLTREILWVERVFEPEVSSGQNFRGFRGGSMASTSPKENLADYWRPGPPLILGSRVIVVPPGEDRIYGFNLVTGERLWRPRRRRDWKAVAALLPARVFAKNRELGQPSADEGALVLVGPSSLAAVSLKDGASRVWTRPLPEELGRPSGMPLVVGNRLLAPVSGGALVALDAATGDILEVSRRTDAGGPARGLGALGVSGGRLVSVAPGGLVGFEDRAGLAADLAAAAQSPGPQDPLLALREAELLRTAGRTADVLAKLDAIGGGPAAETASPEGLSPADAGRFRALLRATLRDAILGTPEGPEPEADRQDQFLARLSALADTPARAVATDRLRADRLRVRGEPAAAVTALRELIGDRLGAGAVPDENPLVPDGNGAGPPPPAEEPDAPAPDAEVRLSRAVSRQLRQVWEAGVADNASKTDEIGRAAVDALAAEWLADAPDGLSPFSSAAELLSFHPKIADALATWSETAVSTPDGLAAENAAAAEIVLLRLADNRGDAVARRAEDILESLRKSGRESASVGGASRAVAEAVAGDAQVRPPAMLPAPAATRPFFRSHVLVSSPEAGRLDVLKIDGPGGRPAVSARFPLLGKGMSESVQRFFRMQGRNAAEFSYRMSQSTGRPAVGSAGGVIFAVTPGAVAAIHPQSGRTLWSRPMEGAEPASPSDLALGVPSQAAGGPRTLQQARRLARNTANRPRSGVIAANAEVVVVLHDRTVTTFDALTGETIWIRRRLEPQNPAAVATSTAVLITPSRTGDDSGLALAARDGAPLTATAERALDVVTHTFAIAGAGVVHVVEGPGGSYFFTAWDPGGDRPLWIRPVDGDAKMVVLPGAGPPTAVIVSPDGPDSDKLQDARLVDLRTGASVNLGGVSPSGTVPQVMADVDRVLFLSRPSRSSRRYAIDDLPTTSVGGTIEMFSRTGGLLWRTDGSKYAATDEDAPPELLHEGFDRAKFVTLLVAKKNAGRGELTTVELIALDKQTGDELLVKVVPVLDEFEQCAVLPSGDAVHLWNDNNPSDEHWRLRLVSAADGALPPPPADRNAARTETTPPNQPSTRVVTGEREVDRELADLEEAQEELREAVAEAEAERLAMEMMEVEMMEVEVENVRALILKEQARILEKQE